MSADNIILLAFFSPIYCGALAWLSCRIGFGIGA